MTHSLQQEQDSLHALCADRRSSRRITNGATVDCREVKTRVIECTATGARVVISGKATVGDVLTICMRTPEIAFDGRARIAWLERLGPGRYVAGLCFERLRRAA